MGGTSDWRSPWPTDWTKNVNLTWSLTYRGISDQRSAWPKDLTKMSTWPEASPMGGSIWLSAEMLSKNLNTLWVLGLASQRSLLGKTKNLSFIRTDTFGRNDVFNDLIPLKYLLTRVEVDRRRTDHIFRPVRGPTHTCDCFESFVPPSEGDLCYTLLLLLKISLKYLLTLNSPI